MQRTEVFHEDDLTGERGASSYKFGLDGFLYEIDLTPDNAEKMREVIKPYAEAGRRIGKIPGFVAQKDRQSVAPKVVTRTEIPAVVDAVERRREIRAFWRSNHKKLGLGTPTERGRIPHEVYAAYEAQTAAPTSGAPAFRAAV